MSDPHCICGKRRSKHIPKPGYLACPQYQNTVFVEAKKGRLVFTEITIS